jgi:uncharacterized protein (TIGR01777 family)
MRILITGATGLVGGSIVNECHARNIGVNYLTTSRKSVDDKDNYKGFYWTPEAREIDTACFEGVTAIINLAGASIGKRWTKIRKRRILDSRLNCLRTLAEGLRQIAPHSVKSLVSASAIGIYPDSLTDYYQEDESLIDDSFLGETVSAWENEADTLAKCNLTVSKIRTGLVLSRRGGALPKLARPIKNYVGATLGNGEQWQSWIHINDLARIYMFALEHKLEGVFNAVAPNPVTNHKLTREIANALHKPLLLPNAPEFILKLLLGEMAYMLLASQRVSCKKIENKGFSFEFTNICNALQELYASDQRETSRAAAT